jgi:mRNA interferase RelE/StbE
MRLVIEKAAMRRLNRLPESTPESGRRRLDEIAADPFAEHANVERYKGGGPDCFRLRHGQWRAIYRIDRKAREVQVRIIDTRGSVYR